MKNMSLAVFALVLLFSCKKSNDSSVAVKLDAIAIKYHLVKSNSSTKLTKSFNTVDELETYLNKTSKAITLKSVISTDETNNISNPKNHIKPSDFGQITGGDQNPFSQIVNYSAYASFTNQGSSGYPPISILSWTTDYTLGAQMTNITSSLLGSGANAGSFSYMQTLSGVDNADGSGAQFNITGIYSETYGVNGIYTYIRNYTCTHIANFNRTAHSIEVIRAFTPM